jgi:GntR family transcriptional regulator/MocR family aminotransferase
LLTLEATPGVPLYRRLTNALRSAILEQRLPVGARLPSTRSLAQDLEISRSTVLVAFEQLATEGYLVSRSGSGTMVADDLPLAATPSTWGDEVAGTERSPRPPARPAPRPFRPGVPALEEFARGPFGRLLRRAWREADPGSLTLGDPAGDPTLRMEVARHLRGSRQVRCTPDDIVITSGAQEGLGAAFAAVARPGERVWMENPGYIGARRALEAMGALPAPVGVDGEGVKVEEGRTRWPDAVAAYVTPSHQFPTGTVLALSRRLQLLEWAAEEDRWIVEDDYDSEFRLAGRPLPALQGLDESGRVVYVGTFSKSLAPALRLGYLVAPPGLRERVVEVLRARAGGGATWLQKAVAAFLSEGHFSRHIRRTRALYRGRRDALAAAVARELAGTGARLRTPTGAMHAVLDLPTGVVGADVARTADGEGVEAIPLSFFAIPPDYDVGEALVLGFAGYDEEKLTRSVGILKQAIGAEVTTPQGARK